MFLRAPPAAWPPAELAAQQRRRCGRGAAASTHASLVRRAATDPRRASRAAVASASGAPDQPLSEAQHKALAAQVTRDLEGTSLFMVGMMGSGKSTVGRLLAQRLGYTHLDTDALVKGATGLSVAQIFEQDGEEGFRDVEAAVLNEVASYARVVVSTGGGVVSRPQNWGHLRNGIVVYLQAPVGLLAARVAADGVALRPLLAGAAPGREVEHAAAKLQEVLSQRDDMYRQADLTVSQLPVEGSQPPVSEAPAATAGRVLAALAAMLEADDTKKRLRSAPSTGSVTLMGTANGPLRI